MTISVIIPTYNEADNIEWLLQYLQRIKTENVIEIMVVDGGSSDDTMAKAAPYAKVYQSPKKGRAAQMNYGVRQSSGTVLQFIHADTIPPTSNFKAIEKAILEGYDAGCFTYRFDSNHPLLWINGFFTRFNFLWCRGGDQAIFTTRAAFDAVKGYEDDFLIMEDFDFIEKIQAAFSFKIIKKNCTVSARKYRYNSYMKVQRANLKVFRMYKKGASQEEMAATYRQLLDTHLDA